MNIHDAAKKKKCIFKSTESNRIEICPASNKIQSKRVAGDVASCLCHVLIFGYKQMCYPFCSRVCICTCAYAYVYGMLNKLQMNRVVCMCGNTYTCILIYLCSSFVQYYVRDFKCDSSTVVRHTLQAKCGELSIFSKTNNYRYSNDVAFIPINC